MEVETEDEKLASQWALDHWGMVGTEDDLREKLKEIGVRQVENGLNESIDAANAYVRARVSLKAKEAEFGWPTLPPVTIIEGRRLILGPPDSDFTPIGYIHPDSGNDIFTYVMEATFFVFRGTVANTWMSPARHATRQRPPMPEAQFEILSQRQQDARTFLDDEYGVVEMLNDVLLRMIQFDINYEVARAARDRMLNPPTPVLTGINPWRDLFTFSRMGEVRDWEGGYPEKLMAQMADERIVNEEKRNAKMRMYEELLGWILANQRRFRMPHPDVAEIAMNYLLNPLVFTYMFHQWLLELKDNPPPTTESLLETSTETPEELTPGEGGMFDPTESPDDIVDQSDAYNVSLAEWKSDRLIPFQAAIDKYRNVFRDIERISVDLITKELTVRKTPGVIPADEIALDYIASLPTLSKNLRINIEIVKRYQRILNKALDKNHLDIWSQEQQNRRERIKREGKRPVGLPSSAHDREGTKLFLIRGFEDSTGFVLGNATVESQLAHLKEMTNESMNTLRRRYNKIKKGHKEKIRFLSISIFPVLSGRIIQFRQHEFRRILQIFDALLAAVNPMVVEPVKKWAMEHPENIRFQRLLSASFPASQEITESIEQMKIRLLMRGNEIRATFTRVFEEELAQGMGWVPRIEGEMPSSVGPFIVGTHFRRLKLTGRSERKTIDSVVSFSNMYV